MERGKKVRLILREKDRWKEKQNERRKKKATERERQKDSHIYIQREKEEREREIVRFIFSERKNKELNETKNTLRPPTISTIGLK